MNSVSNEIAPSSPPSSSLQPPLSVPNTHSSIVSNSIQFVSSLPPPPPQPSSSSLSSHLAKQSSSSSSLPTTTTSNTQTVVPNTDTPTPTPTTPPTTGTGTGTGTTTTLSSQENELLSKRICLETSSEISHPAGLSSSSDRQAYSSTMNEVNNQLLASHQELLDSNPAGTIGSQLGLLLSNQTEGGGMELEMNQSPSGRPSVETASQDFEGEVFQVMVGDEGIIQEGCEGESHEDRENQRGEQRRQSQRQQEQLQSCHEGNNVDDNVDDELDRTYLGNPSLIQELRSSKHLRGNMRTDRKGKMKEMAERDRVGTRRSMRNGSQQVNQRNSRQHGVKRTHTQEGELQLENDKEQDGYYEQGADNEHYEHYDNEEDRKKEEDYDDYDDYDDDYDDYEEEEEEEPTKERISRRGNPSIHPTSLSKTNQPDLEHYSTGNLVPPPPISTSTPYMSGRDLSFINFGEAENGLLGKRSLADFPQVVDPLSLPLPQQQLQQQLHQVHVQQHEQQHQVPVQMPVQMQEQELLQNPTLDVGTQPFMTSLADDEKDESKVLWVCMNKPIILYYIVLQYIYYTINTLGYSSDNKLIYRLRISFRITNRM